MNKTQKAIFEAGIKAFSQKGYHQTTMDEIAETAGVAKGTLYYHFESKEEIFRFIIDEGLQYIEEETLDRTRKLDEPEDKLRGVFKVQLELVIKNIEFYKTLLSQFWGEHERNSHIRNGIERYLGFITEHIRNAMDTTKEDKSEIIAYNFFGIMVSTIVYNLINEEKNVYELTQNLLEQVLKSVKMK